VNIHQVIPTNWWFSYQTIHCISTLYFTTNKTETISLQAWLYERVFYRDQRQHNLQWKGGSWK